MNKVDKEMTIGEVIRMDMGTADILQKTGMHCLGCPSSQIESIKDACSMHGVDVDALVKELNEYLASKQTDK